MKNLLNIVLFILIWGNCYSQWVSNYGGIGDVNFSSAKGNAVATDNSGCSYVTGYCSQGYGNNDIITIKYNATGDTLWTRTHGGSSNLNDEGKALYVDGSGNVYVAGSEQNLNRGYDLTILKYDFNGNLVWFRSYASDPFAAREDKGLAIAADLNGYIYVTGYATSPDGKEDIVTIKYDADGNPLWTILEDGAAGLKSQGLAIAVSAEGNIFVTGFVTASFNNADIIVIAYAPDGNQLWANIYPGAANGEDKAWGIVVDTDNSVIITGYVTSVNGYTDCITAKYDSYGNMLWSKLYDGTSGQTDKAWGIVVDTDGSIYITGQTDEGMDANTNYLVVKYNGSGSQIWKESYNGPANGTDIASSAAILSFGSTGSLVVTGKSWGEYYNFDYATIRYNMQTGGVSAVSRYSMSGLTNDVAKDIAVSSDAKVVITGYSQLIIEASVEQSYISTISMDWGSELVKGTINPEKFSLHQNYPNPFNPSTNIKFDIPFAGNVKLTIYDMMGKVVEVLVNSSLNPGSYNISFGSRALSSGIYFYELTAPGFREVKKMTLVK